MGLSRDTTARQLAGLTDGRRLRTPEAAEYLGIGESTLEKWRCSGQGPMFERSGTRIVVYRVADLEEFLAARRARTNAVASADRMQAELGTRAEEIELLLGALASSHRFVHAVMSVEAGILPGERPPVRPEFRTFAADVVRTLEGLAAELRKTRPGGEKWPDLREEHRRLTESPVAAREQYGLMNVEADRMVNSLNTLREQIVEWRRLTVSR